MIALAFLPLTSSAPKDNGGGSPGPLDDLPYPPWRRTTQFRLTMRANFTAKLSTRPLRCSIQRGQMAISISLIGHGSTSPVSRWRNCWDGGGLPVFIPKTSRVLCGRCVNPLPRESPFKRHHECEEPMASIGGCCTSKFRYLASVETLLSGMVRALTLM